MAVTIPIERLARQIRDEPDDVTIGQLADKYDCSPQRILDAIDVIKIRRNQSSTIPPVEW